MRRLQKKSDIDSHLVILKNELRHIAWALRGLFDDALDEDALCTLADSLDEVAEKLVFVRQGLCPRCRLLEISTSISMEEST